MSTSTVLILGARGRFGLAAARAFASAGWRVLGQVRPGTQPPAEASIEWLPLDLRDTAALARAAQGATVVVHGLNPAYTNAAWQAEAPALLEASIALCRALDATLMLPGNVYNFGAAMPALLREDTPQQALTVKGRVRIALESRLQACGVRAIVVRAGDFFGSGRGTWFDLSIAKDLRKGVLRYPGPRDVPTSWAYLPDLARAFVLVAERRDQLPAFAVLHFAGHVLSGERWLELLNPVARAQGWVRPGVPLRWVGMPWGLIRLGAWLVPTWAALLEMRYLWHTPHALANDRLCALIGAEPRTPLAQAVVQSLADLALLDTASAAGQGAALRA